MLGASLHARSPVFWRPLTGAPALPSITHLVIEGDSITSTSPSAPNGAYAYQYDDSRPDKTIEVRAQSSRTVGLPANLNDDGNSLMGNVAEDMAYGPQLLTAMIGANDMAIARTAAQHKGDLIAYRGALEAASAACKFAWSPPLPYNPTGTPHPSYGHYATQRAAVMADARDPAVWGQWADFYLPLGEHPDFADATLAAPLFGDTVHPSVAGQALLFQVYRTALDSILDASRAASTRMFDAAWPSGEEGLATGATITRRFIVGGLKHSGLALTGGAALAVSGGGGAQVRRAGGAWGASVAGWLYNGDVIDLRLTTAGAAAADTTVTLQVGSESRDLTFRTQADVTPASVVYGGFDGEAPYNDTSRTFAGKAFDTGVAVVAVDTGGYMTRSTGVSVGGTALTFVRRHWTLEIWRGPVTAGDHDIVVTQGAGGKSRLNVQWLTVKDADPTPVGDIGGLPGAEVDPHDVGPMTTPAGGVMVAFLWNYGADPAPTVTLHASDDGGSTLLGQGQRAYQGEASGIAAARRTTTGTVRFANGYGNYARAALVFKPAGS